MVVYLPIRKFTIKINGIHVGKFLTILRIRLQDACNVGDEGGREPQCSRFRQGFHGFAASTYWYIDSLKYYDMKCGDGYPKNCLDIEVKIKKHIVWT